MIRSGLRLSLFVAGVVVIACAPPNAAAGDPNAAPVSHDRSVLTQAELRAATDQYLYDVIQRLRPTWLVTRGATSVGAGRSGNQDPDPVRVYVGMVRVGGPEYLTRLTTASAESLKYFSAAEAQLRFGPGNTNGAIQVVSVPPAPPKP
jgi:hypothetical protein